MKQSLVCLFGLTAMLIVSTSAQAAITCTRPSSTGVSTAFATGGTFPNVTQGTVSFSCTRGNAGDATNVLLRANNGRNRSGSQNRAKRGGNFINYELYKNSGCSGVWSNGNAAAMSVPLNTTVGIAQPQTVSFWGCILTEPVVPAATYTDRVNVRVRNNTNTGNLSRGRNMNIRITNNASCAITSIGNVTFGTYIALRTTPLIAPTANIVMNCTTNLPYTMALDATSGVIAGLNYTLGLSTTNTTGTGPGQTHTITGTMPANQAGTCPTGVCAATQSRTLTITY
ncbi:MAG: spore coat protein U domain-containing protein [Methylophilaceae bacterium]